MSSVRTFELLPTSDLTRHLRRLLGGKSIFIVGPGDAGFFEIRGEEGWGSPPSPTLPVIVDRRLRVRDLPNPRELELRLEVVLPTLAILNVRVVRGREKPLRRAYLFLPPLFDFVSEILEGGKLGLSDGREVVVIDLRVGEESAVHLRRISTLLRLFSSVPDEVLAGMHLRSYGELVRAFPRASWLRDYSERVGRFLESRRRETPELIERFVDDLAGGRGGGRDGGELDYVG